MKFADIKKQSSKTKKILLLLLLVISLFCVFLYVAIYVDPTWPTKARLCQDVEMYIPLEECLGLEDKSAILHQAFPIGSTTSNDVKGTLGAYLYDEYQTENGHIEIYHLNNHLIDFIIDGHIFLYDKSRNLRGISYED